MEIVIGPTVVERDSMTTPKLGHTCYMAPELLDPPQFGFEHGNPSKESDIYAFAMVTYEVLDIPPSCFVARVTNKHDKVLSGMPPYGAQPEDITGFNIVSGSRPTHPRTTTANHWLSGPIWEIITRCWNQTPQFRLSAELLHQGFVESELEDEGTPVTVDGGGEHHMAWVIGEPC